MKEEIINVLKVEPGKAPERAILGNKLSSMQEAVGGLIEFVYLTDTVAVLCNDEGKLIGLEGNRSLGNDILVGTFYVVGFGLDGECVSLSEKEFTEYEEKFKEPQTFTQEEIEANSGYVIYSFS